mmetsp:Transcript_5884/g.8551  ORF Transcript_5884/g.8551 Transcript_5884/m.8551 type:complete len:674 (-) Transcript_5884:340-2361(-)
MMKTHLIVFVSFLLSECMEIQGYLPGVSRKSFSEGDPVKLKVNKMTSTQTLWPVEYYRLPFCTPKGGPKLDNENLGEFLAGDRIENSPYRLFMKEDMYCEQVCSRNVGRGEGPAISPNKVVRAIRKNYHNNWIVDNLPAASKVENDEVIETRYWQGFPIGFIDSGLAYINNHVNIEVQYHEVEMEERKSRIVRLTVEPFSIKHEFEQADYDYESSEGDGENDIEGNNEKEFNKKDILNPIASCMPNGEKVHTSFDMIKGREKQLASGKVLFTYDVIWVENKDLHWASRWDIYLKMDLDNAASLGKIHWISICNGLISVFILSVLITGILLRNLRIDYARYSRIAMDEELTESNEETGWKLVHADVFRPPKHSPMLLAVCCGSGAQLICMTIVTILMCLLGFASPANRGVLITGLLLLYVVMGSVNGYTTARLYKTFKGKSWQKATTFASLFFPGVAFSIFCVLNLVALTQGSSDAVPFPTILVLLVLWFCLCTPLVFLGAYFGFKTDAIEFPVNTSNIPRQIPDQPCFLNPLILVIFTGIVPFGSCMVEVYFIMTSMWLNQFYYLFGFLFLTFFILVITCAEITVLLIYLQLCGEDYQWWWRSFVIPSSTGLYFFGFSIFYYLSLETNNFATYMLYFGYMTLISFALVLMTGFIGVVSSLWFNKVIFSAIKID